MKLLKIFTNSAIQRQLSEKRERLYRMAFAWCNDAYLADDLTQEAMAKALRNQASLKDDARLDAWLFRILSNCWHDHLRRLRETGVIDEETLSHHETPEKHYSRGETVARVRDLVSRLPIGQRQVLTLVDLEEMSYAGAAEVLAIPVGTVMSRLSRARSSLKDMLTVATDIEPDRKPVAARLRRIK